MLEALRLRLFHPPKFRQINFLFWFGFGIVSFLARTLLLAHPLQSLKFGIASGCLGLLFSTLLHWIYRACGPLRVLKPDFIFQVILITILTAALHSACLQGIAIYLNQIGQSIAYPLYSSLLQRWGILTTLLWFVYMSWTFSYLWIKAEFHARQEKQREALARSEAQRLELQLIRFQLDPHFLFNTLNGVAAEIPTHPKIAVNMVNELSTYLKYSLDHRHELITPLRIELEATSSYLRIQKARFGKMLQTKITASQSAGEVLVPSFLLQPVVENAFKYCLSKIAGRRSLLITAQVKGEHLVLRIKNSGKLSLKPDGTGMGMEAVRRRLQVRYPGRHRFTLEQKKDGVVATFELQGEPCSV